MPDYSKFIIYKIQHLTIDDLLYVGGTINMKSRKYHHKIACNNENHNNYNLKLYQNIRANGGFEAFNMIQVCEYPCETKQQSLMEEDRITRELKATLNTNRAYASEEDKKIYKKKYCADNKEHINEKGIDYYQANKDKISELRRAYYQANIDKIREKRREMYNANKDKVNKDKIREKNRAYYQAKKDKIREKNKN
tara:strand:+ start:72 stop:656 length:585 start_codon:yes stop_codon:yes gene_type:complete